MKKIFLMFSLVVPFLTYSNGYYNDKSLVGLRHCNGNISKPLNASLALNNGIFMAYQTQFVDYTSSYDASHLQMFIALSLYLNNGQYCGPFYNAG